MHQLQQLSEEILITLIEIYFNQNKLITPINLSLTMNE